MKIAHVSDTHNHPYLVTQACAADVDLVLITGDCMDNRGRVSLGGGWATKYVISPTLEVKYQTKWLREHASAWVTALAGKPILCVRGNHDFIPYADILASAGADVYEITDKNVYVDLLGKRFAGFRQINPIAGEWAGEEYDIQPYMDRALACDPDILVTHSPPHTILDEEQGYGVSCITSSMLYREHKITHHFFGHCHGDGGKYKIVDGVTYVNGALHMAIWEI